MVFHIISLFPESFDSYINSSIIGRAVCDKKIKIKFYNPRDFSDNKFKHIDQKPYSGGPGMVIQALPVVKAISKAIVLAKKNQKSKIKIIFLSPNEKQFTNEIAQKISKKYSDIIIVCGRYEGIDERVNKIFKTEKISIGPFILTGGELPAMIILDAVSRRIPGVLGKIESLEENRISSPEVYTRPEVFEYKGKKYRVPKILLSGNHAEIEKWKKS